METEFSLFSGGLFNRFFVWMRLEKANAPRLGRRIGVGTGLAMLPLVALCMAQGTAWGDRVRVPLFHDSGVLVRFLFSLPLMIFAEGGIDRGIRGVIAYLKNSGIIEDQDKLRFHHSVNWAQRMANSALAEGLILMGVIAASWLSLDIDAGFLQGMTHWQWDPITQSAGAAGTWFRFVSGSIFRFLMVSWAWRYFVWSWFLWTTSRLKLNLRSTHPDRKGGLGLLSDNQGAFSLLAMAGAAQISGVLIRSVVFEGTPLASYRFLIGGAIGVIGGVFLLPLCVFNRHLFSCRREGLRKYGALAENYTGQFDRKWLADGPAAPSELLGSPDIQSLADLAGGYEVVRQMGLFPLDGRLLSMLTACTAIPFVPLLFFAYGADEVFLRVIKLLI